MFTGWLPWVVKLDVMHALHLSSDGIDALNIAGGFQSDSLCLRVHRVRHRVKEKASFDLTLKWLSGLFCMET